MGCDIHLFCEVKKHINGELRWCSADLFYFDYYFDKFKIKPIFEDRCYSLFANLANVKNDSNNDFIDNPRGIPNDICDIVKEYVKLWEDCSFGHSWLTIQELIDFYDSHPTIKHSGFVSPSEKDGIPIIWCKDTSCQDYIYREWEVKNEVLEELIEKLKERAGGYRYDNFRIVFFFDN